MDFALILVGWALAQGAVFYFQNRSLIVARIELLMALRDEISLNAESKLIGDDKFMRLRFSSEVYRGSANRIGFLQRGDIKRVISHYLEISNYEHSMESIKWAAENISLVPIELQEEKKKEIFKRSKKDGKEHIDLIRKKGRTSIKILDNAISNITSNKYYFLTNITAKLEY